jgi:hypothetical protein
MVRIQPKTLYAFHWSNYFPLPSPVTSLDRPVGQRMLRYYNVIILIGRPWLRPSDLLKLACPVGLIGVLMLDTMHSARHTALNGITRGKRDHPGIGHRHWDRPHLRAISYCCDTKRLTPIASLDGAFGEV